jgi:hypothetical protein
LFPKNARSGASLALALLLCLAPALARSGEKDEIHPSLIVEQDYDSNIFNVPNTDPNKKGSPVTIIRPTLALETNGTLGRYYLDGYLSSHIFWNESDLTGVDRGVAGGLDRTIFPRFSIFGDGSYQRLAPHAEIRAPNETSMISPGPGEGDQPVILPGQLIEGSVPDVDLAQGEIGGRYLLTPLDKLTLSGGPYSIDYLGSSNSLGRTDLRDRQGWFTKLNLAHNLSYLDTVSFELSASSTDTADAVFRPVPVNDPFNPHFVALNTGKDTSDLQSFTIGWDRNWDELWVTHFEIGVRRLDTSTSGAQRQVTRVGPSAGGGVAPFTDFIATDFDAVGPGLIGSLTIRRALPRGRVEFSYSRETRTTSSLFTNNLNVDSLALAYIHNLSAHASFGLTATYEHYKTVNDNPQIVGAEYIANSFNPITGPSFACPSGGKLVLFGSGVDKAGQCQIGGTSRFQSDALYGEARVDWQLRKRLSTFVSLRYTQRTGDVQLFGPAYNKWNVGVGFSWDYSLGF